MDITPGHFECTVCNALRLGFFRILAVPHLTLVAFWASCWRDVNLRTTWLPRFRRVSPSPNFPGIKETDFHPLQFHTALFWLQRRPAFRPGIYSWSRSSLLFFLATEEHGSNTEIKQIIITSMFSWTFLFFGILSVFIRGSTVLNPRNESWSRSVGRRTTGHE